MPYIPRMRRRLSRFDAVLFDLDGVLTPTADRPRAGVDADVQRVLETQPGRRPFSRSDYHDFIDGRPRFDGVRTFLASRDIDLPEEGRTMRPASGRWVPSATARTSSSITYCSPRASRRIPARSACSISSKRKARAWPSFVLAQRPPGLAGVGSRAALHRRGRRSRPGRAAPARQAAPDLFLEAPASWGVTKERSGRRRGRDHRRGRRPAGPFGGRRRRPWRRCGRAAGQRRRSRGRRSR